MALWKSDEIQDNIEAIIIQLGDDSSSSTIRVTSHYDDGIYENDM
jgi:hypothetical protein